ncbi:hypothetical protein [Neolewinella sp.]|uniref:hypothetical protein n=1 Tax=Neolewinella sp. TaxID=2993543 RepID=UPI003B5197C3
MPRFDGNGTILGLDRWFRAQDPVDAVDGAANRLNYRYTAGTNLLAAVEGSLASAGDPATGWQPFDYITGRQTYAYDRRGNLVSQMSSERPEEVVTIRRNPYGEVRSVQTADASISNEQQYRTTFGYGPDQQRWARRRLTAAPGSGRDAEAATYYVRDAQGLTALATYQRERDYDAAIDNYLDVEPFTLRQQYLFGSARLGEVRFDRAVVDAKVPATPLAFGKRRYELTNHLNNVTTVFSEYLADYTDRRYVPFTALELLGHEDYLAFGLGLRRAPLSDYRFGLNGKERDDAGEWGATTNLNGTNRSSTHYDYDFRIYN